MGLFPHWRSELLVQRYIEFVLRYRAAVLAVCVVLSLGAGAILSQGVFASSLVKLFFGNSPEYSRYRTLADGFGESDVIFIVVEDAKVFSDDGWKALHEITEELGEHPEVRRVTSLSNVQLVESTGDELIVERYNKMITDRGMSLRELQALARADPNISNSLLGRWGDVPAFVIELTPKNDRPVEALPGFMAELFNVFHKHGLKREKLHIAGFVPETIEVTAQARYSMATIFPVTSIILVGIVFILFGQVWPVIATGGVGIIAILWTFAFAIFLDNEINLMLAMVPAVMMVVSFSDIVHLCSTYVLELKDGYDKQAAIIKSATEVGQACFFTSVTTFFGFVAIAFVPTPVFRNLGVVLGAGVAIALLLAMTLVPILFSLMPTPDVAAENRYPWVVYCVDWITHQCRRVSVQRPKTIVFLFILLTAGAFHGVSLMKIETNMQERLEPDNHIRKAQVFIQEHFAGTNNLDFYLTSPEPEQLLTADNLGKLQRVQGLVEERSDVDRTNSLVNLVELLHKEMANLKVGTLPESDALISQYLLLFEMSGGDALSMILNDDRTTLRLSVRVPDAGLVGAAHLGDEISALVQETMGPEIQVEATGLSYLFGKWVKFIIDGQKRGLAFAFLSTTIMMIVCLRLFGAGLVSMIPNALPLVVLGGVLGLFQDAVDSDTMMIGMIAIGIAVDDTVHFLTRLRLEASRVEDMDEALWRTFRFTGRAIVHTSIILCLGLSPFLLSDYLTTQLMGSLLPLTLVMALISDLLLLPALVKLGVLRIPIGTELKPLNETPSIQEARA